MYSYRPVEQPDRNNSPSISNQKLSLYTAGLHLLQAIIALVLVFRLNSQTVNNNGGIFSLTKDIQIWTPLLNSSLGDGAGNSFVGNYSLTYTNVYVGKLDVRYSIVAFFILSAFFQGTSSILSPELWFNTITSQWRYLEYSISASVMIICIAVEAGISDVYTIVCIFTLIFATQILGLLADLLSTLTANVAFPQNDIILYTFGQWTWVVPHMAAWCTCITAYSPILDAYFQSVSHSPSANVPGFVTGLIMAEMILFVCFGFVQAYSLVYKTLIIQTGMNNNEALDALQERVERMFIILSLTAKSILAWVILAPILMASN